MRARQDVLDFFGALRSSRNIGYAKSYYWDYVVNNVRLPRAADFDVSEDVAEAIRDEIDHLVK